MTILYFSDAREFEMIYCHVTQNEKGIEIGYQDVLMIYSGQWSRTRSTIHVNYRLLYRALPHLGDDPTRHRENLAIRHGAIAYRGHTFHREPRLDSVAASAIAEFDSKPPERAVRH